MKHRQHSVRSALLLLIVTAAICGVLYLGLNMDGKGRVAVEPSVVATSPKDGASPSESPAPKKKVEPPSNPEVEPGQEDPDTSERRIVLEELPHTAYLQFLDRAESGDPRAQLILAEILERCRHSSVQSPEALARLESRGDLSPELLTEYRVNLGRCGGLYKLLGEYDLDTLWAFWLEEAAEKLAVARVALSLSNLEAEDSDALYRQLQTGVAAADGDWIQQRVIRQSAFAFFRMFVEPTQYEGDINDSGYYLRSEDSLAWDYLMCENSVNCDLQALEQQVSSHYYDYQISDMRKRAKELDGALKDGDWERLGLRPESE